MPRKSSRVGVDPARVLDELGDRERGERLAGARLADDADRLAAAHGERHAAHRADRPVRPGEGHLEVAHVEHDVSRECGGAGVGRRGAGSAAAAGDGRARQPVDRADAEARRRPRRTG